jgi:alanine racemase|tara:strand:+ start:395 stop:1552 length:1158 start_codon:yes stop_codon:yes gene_type:complete
MPQPQGTSNANLLIDLKSIEANWSILKELNAPSSTAAVVKSDAYGLGVNKIIPTLISAGCKTFFVATIEEAIVVRRLIAENKILVLFGINTFEEASTCIEYNLTPVLNHLGQLEIWKKIVSKDDKGIGRPTPKEAWLHLDTGMTRLGFPNEELEAIKTNPELINNLNIGGVMSHLVCSENVNNPINAAQLSRFTKIKLWLESYIKFNAMWSLANSSGVFLGPAYHFDITRPGAALYGINPQPEKKSIMNEVVRLQAKILQVQRVDTNQTVGYGATYKVKKPGRIATIGVGYADGYMRAGSGFAQAYIGDFRIPVVGRISMDLITLDISAVPERYSHVGSIVDLIGPNYSVDSLAKDSGTIGYEILTSLGKRYNRTWEGIGNTVKN